MSEALQTKLSEPAHKLTLDARARLSMTGVLEVESFDDTAVILRTTRGTLIVRGVGLHLQQLSLDGGQVLIDGEVDALTYEDEAPSSGFFARLFG